MPRGVITSTYTDLSAYVRSTRYLLLERSALGKRGALHQAGCLVRILIVGVVCFPYILVIVLRSERWL